MADEVMTLENLNKIIEENVNKGVTKSVTDAIDKFKKDFAVSSMKSIFPNAEDASLDNDLKTFAGSVLDPYVLSKACEMAYKGGLNDAPGAAPGHAMGMHFVNNGLFKRVSPAVYKFGELLQNWTKSGPRGSFDLGAYNKIVSAGDRMMGFKAATDMGAASGIPIPTEYPAMMIEVILATSPILQRVWRLPMNAATAKYPRLVQSDGSYFGGMAVTWSGPASSGEGTALNHTKPTLNWNTFYAKKASGITYLTEELMQDSVINILNYMSGLYVRTMMYEFERVIIAGNGVDEPLGIIKDSTIINKAVPRKTVNKIGYQDLVKLEGEVDEAFPDDRLFWVTRRATVAAIRAEEDTVGQPKVRDSYTQRNDQGTLYKTLLGHPYHVSRNVPALGSTGDLIVGDFGMYQFLMRQDLRIDVSDAPGWTTDQMAIRLIARADGMPGTPFAFKMLKGAVS